MECHICHSECDSLITPCKCKESKECRICHSGGDGLITPCKCTGSMEYIHTNCLKEWINSRDGTVRDDCELCGKSYSGIRRIDGYLLAKDMGKMFINLIGLPCLPIFAIIFLREACAYIDIHITYEAAACMYMALCGTIWMVMLVVTCSATDTMNELMFSSDMQMKVKILFGQIVILCFYIKLGIIMMSTLGVLIHCASYTMILHDLWKGEFKSVYHNVKIGVLKI
jgi:hypothetical protein